MIKTKTKTLLITLLLIICCFLCCLSSSLSVFASSVSVDSGYSNVLEDLQKDKLFNADNYPAKMDDYSLEVIHIAESNDKELFIYVYQPNSPNNDLTATSINISTIEDINNPAPKNYKLLLLNSNGVFCKFKVKDFVVSNDSVRYYDIISIYRKWNEMYDNGYSFVNDNTIQERAFNVATRFTARYDNEGNLCYSHSGIEVVTILEKYNGRIRYSNGTVYNIEDRFFTAFKSDRSIDSLLEAEIQYIKQSIHYEVRYGNYDISNPDGYNVYHYGEKETIQKVVKHENKVDIQVGLIFKQKFSWKEIQSASDFVKDNEVKLSETAQSNLLSKDWVLNFDTAEYKNVKKMSLSMEVGYDEYYTNVNEVTILRLKYVTDGITYNLGVVDNKSTGSNELAGTSVTLWEKIQGWIKIAIALIGLILLIVVLSPILPIVFTLFGKLLKLLFKIIIWIISIPIKILKFIFKKRKNT